MSIAFSGFQMYYQLYDTLYYFELGVDILFFIDIFLAFFTAYLRVSTGDFIYSPKMIAKRYVTSSFIIDFLSVIPVIAGPVLEAIIASSEAESENLSPEEQESYKQSQLNL